MSEERTRVGTKPMNPMWIIWLSFLIIFFGITLCGIWVLSTPEAKSTIAVVPYPTSAAIPKVYWDTRFLMSGYLNTDIGKDVVHSLYVEVFSKTKLYEFGYEHTTNGDCCHPINNSQSLSDLDIYDSWQTYSSEHKYSGRNAFPKAIGPHLYEMYESLVDQDTGEDALEVLVTNTWFDIPESYAKEEAYGEVIENMKSLLSAGQNCSIIYIDLPWESEYGSAARTMDPKKVDKPLYILIVGNKQKVFEFTEEIAKILEGIIPSKYGIAMRNLEYGKPIFTNKAPQNEAISFPDLELFLSPVYASGDLRLPSAKIIISECKNLEPQQNVMRYNSDDQKNNNGVGAREKAWDSSARLGIPYRYSGDDNPVFKKVTSVNDVRVEVSYFINTDKKRFSDIEDTDYRPAMLQHTANEECSFSIKVDRNLYSSSAEFSVVVRLSVYSRNSPQRFLEYLGLHDAYKQHSDVSAVVSHAWTNNQFSQPELTFGICSLFIEGWTEKNMDASKSILHSGSNESLIQEVFTEFHMKGDIWGVLRDLGMRFYADFIGWR